MKTNLNKISALIAWGAVTIFIILFGIASLFWAFTKEMAFQSRAIPNIEQALGISIGTPYVDGREVVRYSVNKDGYAYSKGLRTNDILTRHADDFPKGDTHRALYNSQGGTVVFHVRRGDEIIKMTFSDIPMIGTDCLNKSDNFDELLQSMSSLRAFNWLIKKAGGCPL